MKFREINARFTEKVAEYMAKGWMLNAGTMNGSQGEVAKVDLTDGNRVLRIMITKEHGYGDFWYDGYALIVGFAEDNIKANAIDIWQTVWNNRLEVVSKEMYYNAGLNIRADWYVTEEEARANYEKMVARYKNRVEVDKDIELDERASEIALSFVKSQYRCGRAKACDIKVTKKIHHEYGVRWYVTYKNHSWVLA